MSEISKKEYQSRICKVQDYIEKSYFHNISVEKLAEVAGFSRYHFSRIFKSIMHQSISQYVNRIRIEHSRFLLAYRTELSLTDIALQLGYTDSAVFSRAFKAHYGSSPSVYRKKYSTKCKEEIFISEYNEPVKKKQWVQEVDNNFGVIRIEERDRRKVVYVRHVGNYAALEWDYEKMMHKLFTEANKQGLLEHNDIEILAMYHDNPEFGQEDQFRTSLCISLPEEVKALDNEELGVMEMKGGLYAIGHFEIQRDQFQDAWDFMYQQWLLTSDYVPRDTYPFEVYLNNPKAEADCHIAVDIYMPIEPI